MKKKLVGVSIAITIFSALLLYQGLYNLDSFLQFYLRCLNEKAAGRLPDYYSCPDEFNDIHLILTPIALFGMTIWLGYWGFRNSLAKALSFRIIIPVLIALAASVMLLVMTGITAIFNYLNCIKQCPSGGCGVATGTQPPYSCSFPTFEFAIPLVIIATASLLIIAYRMRRLRDVQPPPDS